MERSALEENKRKLLRELGMVASQNGSKNQGARIESLHKRLNALERVIKELAEPTPV